MKVNIKLSKNNKILTLVTISIVYITDVNYSNSEPIKEMNTMRMTY